MKPKSVMVRLLATLQSDPSSTPVFYFRTGALRCGDKKLFSGYIIRTERSGTV
jgi:hypothetical protein